MAKQESIITMRGKVVDLSFTKHRIQGYEAPLVGAMESGQVAGFLTF